MCDSTHCSANDRVGTVRSACPRRCRSASMHGFGLATARTLCEDGARVVVTSRSSERAEEGSSERAEEVAAALPNAIGTVAISWPPMVQRDCSANRLNVSATLTSSCSMDPARRPELPQTLMMQVSIPRWPRR